MRLLLIGFGTVGQGLAELLIEKEKLLLDQYGLRLQVVGIADMLKGSLYDAGGIDVPAALKAAKSGGKISGLPHKYEGDALSMIKMAEADMMVEATYTDIKTAEPATSHIRAALEKGMHVTTTNKGPGSLYYLDLAELADARSV